MWLLLHERLKRRHSYFIKNPPVKKDYSFSRAEDRNHALDVDDVLLGDDANEGLVRGRQRWPLRCCRVQSGLGFKTQRVQHGTSALRARGHGSCMSSVWDEDRSLEAQEVERAWRTVRLPGLPVVLAALRVMYVTVPEPSVMFTGSGSSVTCAQQGRLLKLCAWPYQRARFFSFGSMPMLR